MKKVLAVILTVALLGTVAFGVISSADSKAADLSAYDTESVYTGVWTADGADSWKIGGGDPQSSDGEMVVGWNAGGWTTSCYYAFLDKTLDQYTFEFKFSTDNRDCYSGVAIRSPQTGNNPMNGGRFGRPAPDELSCGLIFDLGIADRQNEIGITFCDGVTANSQVPSMTVPVPAGFSVKDTHTYKIVDTGDVITLYIDGSELFTITLNGDNAVIYYTNANGEEASQEFTVTVLDSGIIGFYQRNCTVRVSDIKLDALRAKSGSTPDETGDVTPTTEENTPTGDVSVAVFAAVIAVAMGAAVVFSKKRAF